MAGQNKEWYPHPSMDQSLVNRILFENLYKLRGSSSVIQQTIETVVHQVTPFITTASDGGYGAGDVSGPVSSLTGDIPQFADTTGKLLEDGLGLATTVGTPGSDSNVPSEKAVRAAIPVVGTSAAAALVTSVGTPGLDTNVPSEKAVSTALGTKTIVTLTHQAAVIGATNLLVGGVMAPAGVYRVSGYFVVSIQGSGSAVISIAWNDGVWQQTVPSFGGALVVLGAYMQTSVVIRTDGAHHISYSATYTGGGGAAYDFYLVMGPA